MQLFADGGVCLDDSDKMPTDSALTTTLPIQFNYGKSSSLSPPPPSLSFPPSPSVLGAGGRRAKEGGGGLRLAVWSPPLPPPLLQRVHSGRLSREIAAPDKHTFVAVRPSQPSASVRPSPPAALFPHLTQHLFLRGTGPSTRRHPPRPSTPPPSPTMLVTIAACFGTWPRPPASSLASFDPLPDWLLSPASIGRQ